MVVLFVFLTMRKFCDSIYIDNLCIDGKGDGIMKVSKDLSTGTIPMMVLSVISSEDMYGYKIIKSLEARSDNVFSLKEGTLYPILHSLEQEGYVESYWDTSTGRKKKYYQITKQGVKQLKAKQVEFEEFTASVKKVLSFA